MISEYQTAEKALAYLEIADSIPCRAQGERVVLELLPKSINRVLDLGTGDGRLLTLLLLAHPNAHGIATDFSPTMLEKARVRFDQDARVEVLSHDFRDSILKWGEFDAVVSSFAIHHVEDDRKFEIYQEIFQILKPGGVFVNLEHVASPTEKLHDDFLSAMGMTRESEDQSNRCLSASTQLSWLSHIGYENVDCFWKWRELAVLSGAKPNIS